jgi:hypothetical protein
MMETSEGVQAVITVDQFTLPKELSVPDVNASSIIIFGKPKCGKTTALSKLKNCLIIDTEKGSDKVSALRMQVPQDLGPVGKMNWLMKLADKLIEEGRPYDYIALDTFSEVNDWAEWSGTYRYMNSMQGKSFNRELDSKGQPIKGGKFLEPSDINYQSVHSLAEGYGYRWSREDAMKVFDKYLTVAKKCVIFVCHVEDKYISAKEQEGVLPPKQLALTGKLRDILPRKVDAIGYVYRKEGDVVKVNFGGGDERVGGTRAQHLADYNGPLDWSRIFI